MRVAIIGRTEILYATVELIAKQGHEIALIITAKAAPEYTKTADDFASLAKKLAASYVYSATIIETAGLVDSLPPIDIGLA
jgi:UDP-4-amino-4-deoxy-L-arabinose formyltransferase/UDP-glucuronic acid dehydrogenase (UDP-4-keto-hexauronic acid decarboxylating)